MSYFVGIEFFETDAVKKLEICDATCQVHQPQNISLEKNKPGKVDITKGIHNYLT